MSEITLYFSLKGKRTKIMTNKNAYFREPAKQYALSIGKELYELIFVCNLLKIHINSTIEEVCKEKQEVEIVVCLNDLLNRETKLKYKINENDENIQIFGEVFVKNNKNNFKIILNNQKEQELSVFYDIKKNPISYKSDIIEFKLKQINEITDLSMMFQGCRNLVSLPDLSLLETDKVTDISYMFSNCSSLSSLPDISTWNTENVTNMSSIFYGCTSLSELPDISYWNTKNVTDMSFLFYNCSLLKSLPNISKWDTKEVTDMSYMFFKCSSLKSMPDIQKWNIKKLINISNILSECSSLDPFPDISGWHDQILINLRIFNNNDNEKEKIDSLQMINEHFFLSCKKCKNIPEIILKDNENILLKCNNCGMSESQKLENICNFQSSWINELVKFCNKHIEKESKKYCVDCNLFLCAECLTNHRKQYDNHELIEIKEKFFNLCVVHKKEYTHYCIDCKKEICTKCQSDHINHDIKEISNININDIFNKDKKEEKEKEKEEEKEEDKKSDEKKDTEKDENKKFEDSNNLMIVQSEEENKKNDEGDNDDENNKEEKNDKDNNEDDNDNKKNKSNQNDEEKKEEINNFILNLSLYENFLKNAKEMRDKKDKIIKDQLLGLRIYQDMNESLKKTLNNYSNDFNKILNDDLNFLILSKIIFISCKRENIVQNEIISNLNNILNIIAKKFTEEEFEKFKDYMNSKKKEFSLCLKELSPNEVEKLQTNLEFLFKPVNKNLSDFDKTKSFVSKNIESSQIMKKHLIIEKIKDPDKFINIDNTLKNAKNISKILNSKEDGPLVMSLFGKCIQENGIEVLASKTQDKQFKNIELASLNSLISLGNQKQYEIFFDYNEEKINKIINDVVEKEKFCSKLKLKLATKFKISKDEIIFNELERYEDLEKKKTFLKISFSVLNEAQDFTKELKEFIKEEKDIEIKLNYKSLIEALEFSPELLDPRGDKYEGWCKNNIRGGEIYIPPDKDWFGLGLKVKDKYENNDWLGCQNKKGEYAIAYIGINNLLNNRKQMIKEANEISEKISKMITHKLYQFDTNIKAKGCVCEKCGPKCGEGVTLFQNPSFAENSAGILDILGYRIKIILMCRVNPFKIRQPKKFPSCWILNPTPDEIRPYRILIKKIPYSPLAQAKNDTNNNEIITCNTPVDYIISAIQSKDYSFAKEFKQNKKFEDNYLLNGQILNDDFFVIRLYSSSYYKNINEYMRTKKTPDDVFNEKEIISWISCLQLALSRNKNVEDDTIVYRGIGNRKFPQSIGVGSKFYFREFTSTSKDKSAAEEFQEDEGTLLIIRIKNNGTNGYPNYCFYINDISHFDNEEEVLISSHCYYIVTKIEHKRDIDYVYLTCEGYLLKDMNVELLNDK